jgi:hypothetical protein
MVLFDEKRRKIRKKEERGKKTGKLKLNKKKSANWEKI